MQRLDRRQRPQRPVRPIKKTAGAPSTEEQSNAMSATATEVSAPTQTYDALVIGAGMSGLYQLIRLRELGLNSLVLEAGTGVGGTWYWNRYPGCRFDSESYSYGYLFSKELFEEWEWREHFAGQPETEGY